MSDKGDSFAHGMAMPTTKEGMESMNSIAEIENLGEEFFGSKSGGGPMLKSGGNRSGPLPEGANPYYSGGKKAERGD